MNQTILRIVGIVGIAVGTTALVMTGVKEEFIASIVAAICVLVGLIGVLFTFAEKKPKE